MYNEQVSCNDCTVIKTFGKPGLIVAHRTCTCTNVMDAALQIHVHVHVHVFRVQRPLRLKYCTNQFP